MGDDTHRDLQDEFCQIIQERSAAFLAPNDEMEEDGADGSPTAGLLVNWHLVCEWAGDDGRRWLSYHRNNDQATWEARGLLTEAVADLP